MQHVDEVVDVVGPVAAGIQRLGQREEGLRVIGEVVDVEDGLWVRDAVLLQVGVESRSWSSAATKHKPATNFCLMLPISTIHIYFIHFKKGCVS